MQPISLDCKNSDKGIKKKNNVWDTSATPGQRRRVSSVVGVIPSASQDMALQTIVSRPHDLICPSLDCLTALLL